MLRPTFHIQPSSAPSSGAALFEISPNHCSFAMLDTGTKKLVEFAHYEMDKGRELFVQSVFRNHDPNGAPVYIGYWTNASIIVPSKHFRLQDAEGQVEMLNGKSVAGSVLTEAVSDWNVHNVYRMPREVSQAVASQTGHHYWHHVTLWLKNHGDLPGAVLCDFRSDEFSVIVTKGHSLLLSSVYTYTNPADVLFHLLKIFDVFELSQRDVPVLVSGFIDESSALMKELHKYFLHVEFGQLANGISLDDSFSDYPSHFFNSISNLAACVSSEVR